MKLTLTFLLLAAGALVACGKPLGASQICQELDLVIDENIKRIAFTLADGEQADKGAVQQGARYTMVNNRLQVIRLNLDLQVQHNCPLRKSAIDPLVYSANAKKCMTATIIGQADAASLCAVKSWKPE